MRPIDPDLLGPLDESAPLGAPGPLFRNDEHWLGASETKRRAAIWNALAPRIEKICAPDEKVIFVARAYRQITVGAYFALGWLAQRYGQVTLVVTDRRLIEVMNDSGGVGVEGGTRSFLWAGVSEVRYGLRKLTIVGRDGKKHRFVPRTGGDRRVLKALVPRISQRLLLPSAEAPPRFPVEHCPSCFAPSPRTEPSCAACGSLTRSSRVATWLSLAFPGGGLAYLGHPVLAFLDFVGEIVIFGLIAAGLASASSAAEVVAGVVAGAVLGALTKIESIHVGHHLAGRRRAETQEHRARFATLGKAGALLTIVAIAGAGLVTGRLAGKPHDLDFAGATGWTGSRSRSAWTMTADYEHPRSEWTHENGLVATVSSIPDTHVEDVEAFQTELTQVLEKRGDLGTLLFRGKLGGGLAGFQHAWKLPEERGAFVVCYVVDGSDGGVQQVHSLVSIEDEPAAVELLGELVAKGRWIEPVEPLE
jgi:hypothetical protein